MNKKIEKDLNIQKQPVTVRLFLFLIYILLILILVLFMLSLYFTLDSDDPGAWKESLLPICTLLVAITALMGTITSIFLTLRTLEVRNKVLEQQIVDSEFKKAQDFKREFIQNKEYWLYELKKFFKNNKKVLSLKYNKKYEGDISESKWMEKKCKHAYLRLCRAVEKEEISYGYTDSVYIEFGFKEYLKEDYWEGKDYADSWFASS